MNPVVIALDGDTGDTGILERHQGLDGSGKGPGQDLPRVKQVAANQHKIDLFIQRIFYNARQASKEIFVTLFFPRRVAVGFAQVDVGCMDKTNGHIVSIMLLARIIHELHSYICKSLRGAAVICVPQIPDNAANGRIRLARRVNFFCHDRVEAAKRMAASFSLRNSLHQLTVCCYKFRLFDERGLAFSGNEATSYLKAVRSVISQAIQRKGVKIIMLA